jgi:hypothetical protein
MSGACVDGFQALGLSVGGEKPHPACAGCSSERPAAPITSAATRGRIELFMTFPQWL